VHERGKPKFQGLKEEKLMLGLTILENPSDTLNRRIVLKKFWHKNCYKTPEIQTTAAGWHIMHTLTSGSC
jgi:hypothetical protein